MEEEEGGGINGYASSKSLRVAPQFKHSACHYSYEQFTRVKYQVSLIC